MYTYINVVYSKYITILSVNYISIKLEGKVETK